MDTLEISNLTKSYGKKIVLKNIALSCRVGEIIGLFGRNGAGKSTLLKLIYGTEKAESMTIRLNFKTLIQKDIIPYKLIAYLPQHSFLPKELTVRKVIPFFFPNPDGQNKILSSPKVSSFETLKVGKLSLGQLRYLELLIIGHLDHPFIMLDEPFSMVESDYSNTIKDLLLELKKTKGIILTDHYYNDVSDVTDRNYIIKNGENIELKTKEELGAFEYLRFNEEVASLA